MALQRRTAAAPVPQTPSVDFGDLDFYSGGGFTLPPGRYALEFDVRLHAYTKGDGTRGVENLGVMVTALPMNEANEQAGDPMDQFYSMGSKAKLSFAPNPDTGKGVVPIPGGPAQSLARSTNWNVLLKSLYDAGLPKGIFTNDLSTIDGVWVVTQNIPEPEERKTFGAKTGEAEQERGNQMISVVSEIIEEGKPWEGGGGAPAEATTPASKPNGKAGKPTSAPAKAAAAPTKVAAKKAPVPEPAEEVGEDDILQAALLGTAAVLEVLPEGGTVSKLALRTGTFKAVTTASSDDMAQAVLETFFGDDKTLNGLIGQHGYKVQGLQIKPA